MQFATNRDGNASLTGLPNPPPMRFRLNDVHDLGDVVADRRAQIEACTSRLHQEFGHDRQVIAQSIRRGVARGIQGQTTDLGLPAAPATEFHNEIRSLSRMALRSDFLIWAGFWGDFLEMGLALF